MTDKLVRDNPKIDISLVLTEYILSNVKSMDETPYSNCTEVIVYMTSRRIYPRFDLLLPTRTLFASEFFQTLNQILIWMKLMKRLFFRQRYNEQQHNINILSILIILKQSLNCLALQICIHLFRYKLIYQSKIFLKISL